MFGFVEQVIRSSAFFGLSVVSASATRAPLTNTNPYGTKTVAVGTSGCACGAQQVKVRWYGVGRRGCHVALVCVCVLSLKPFLGCLTPPAFFVWCSPAGGCVQSIADFWVGGVRGTSPSVGFISWVVCWCVCVGVTCAPETRCPKCRK